MTITDKDLTTENGVKMLQELFAFADQRITVEDATLRWLEMTTAEKMQVKTGHFQIIGH